MCLPHLVSPLNPLDRSLNYCSARNIRKHHLFLSIQAAMAKYHKLQALNDRYLLFLVMDTVKSKIKVLVDSEFEERLLPGL